MAAAAVQDAIIMNLDDLLCVGATDNILLVPTCSFSLSVLISTYLNLALSACVSLPLLSLLSLSYPALSLSTRLPLHTHAASDCAPPAMNGRRRPARVVRAPRRQGPEPRAGRGARTVPSGQIERTFVARSARARRRPGGPCLRCWRSCRTHACGPGRGASPPTGGALPLRRRGCAVSFAVAETAPLDA